MNRRILMVSTASRWLGTARMPRSLARAGFEVSLLAPRDSLALRSRFVSKSSVLHDESTPMQWLLSLVAMIKEVEPRLVVPCDEVAIRLLFELVRNSPRDLAGEEGTRIKLLVQQSLGNPEHYDRRASTRRCCRQPRTRLAFLFRAIRLPSRWSTHWPRRYNCRLSGRRQAPIWVCESGRRHRAAPG